MSYTFIPEHKHAKAYGRNMRVSKKSAVIVCAAVRNKPLTRAKRLLADLKDRRRSLRGKYYSKTVEGILQLLESCEKNAESLGLDAGRLFVNASAHQGTMIRRRRRKAAFGSLLKSTNVEIFLIERGRVSEEREKGKKQEVREAMKQQVQKMREKEDLIVRKETALEDIAESEQEKKTEEKLEKDMEAIEEKGIEGEVEELHQREKEMERRVQDLKTRARKKTSDTR